MLYTGSIFAPPKPGSALRGMYYLAAWGALLFFRMPLDFEAAFESANSSKDDVYSTTLLDVPLNG